MGITVKQNKSLASISAKIDEVIEEKSKFYLRGIASDLVAYSPVWSGAYVTSHSFVPKGSGAGRMRKSTWKKADAGAKKSEAYSQLVSDIERVNFVEAGVGVFRNRAPHAQAVERGSDRTRGYKVYTKTANRWS